MASIGHSAKLQEDSSSRISLILEKLDSMEQSSAIKDLETVSGPQPCVEGVNRHRIVNSQPQTVLQEPYGGLLDQRCRTRCPEWCSCQCHSQYSIQPPWIMKAISGLSSLELRPGSRPCNDRSCRGFRMKKIGVTIRLPSYLFGRYVAIALSYSELQGPCFSLRMPRVMSWSHSLWHYANQGNLTAIQTMFSKGQASPYDVNPRGASALLYAAPYPKVARLLVQNGADLHMKDDRGRSAIDLLGAILLSGKLEVEDLGIVRSLLDSTDYTETRNFSTLHKIVLGISPKDLDLELGDSLVDVDAPDVNGQTPLIWAVIRDDVTAASKLLKHRANPAIQDNSGNTPLHYVQSIPVCRLLLSHGADIRHQNNGYKRTALHMICKRLDSVELVDMIVRAGGDVDERDADNETPLINAIYRHATSTAKYLIDAGVSLDAANLGGRNRPIHYAVTYNHHEILQYLLDKGADYTATNLGGKTIAHRAAHYGDAMTMAILASADLTKLNVNARDNDGRSPADYLSARNIPSEPESEIHYHAKRIWCLQSATANNEVQDAPDVRPMHGYYVPGSFPHCFWLR